jgi:hypothetical protein
MDYYEYSQLSMVIFDVGRLTPGIDRETLEWRERQFLAAIQGHFNALDEEGASQKRKDEAKRQLDALAKGLPAIAGGMRDAIFGFQKGDPFAGSAGVMEICSSLASTIGGMVGGAAGPVGPLIGALFSIVSMILKCFVKEAKPLTKQIEEILREIGAEQEIKALNQSAEAIESFLRTTPRLAQSQAAQRNLLDLIDGNAINSLRGARSWLRQPKNQSQKRWDEVLAAQCRTYARLMQAVTIAASQLETADDVRGAFLDALESNHPDQLSFLEDMRAAARDRGLVWYIGVFGGSQWEDAGSLYAYTRDRSTEKDLEGQQRVVAVAPRRGETGEPEPFPYLAVFALELLSDYTDFNTSGAKYRYRRNQRTYGLFGKWPLDKHSGWKEIPGLVGLTDISATPGAKKGQVYVYTADGKRIRRYVSEPSAQERLAELTDVSVDVHRRSDEGADSVSAVAAAQVDGGGEDWLVYFGGSGPNGARYLRAVGASGASALVPETTVRFNDVIGMKIDSERVWVFSRQHIACATHTSVLKGAEPDWAFHSIPAHLVEGRVNDIAPCDDGSLLAVFGNRIYTSVPDIDHGRRTIAIKGETVDDYGYKTETDGWTAIPDVQAQRVHKEPIHCWRLLEGLEQALQPAPARL